MALESPPKLVKSAARTLELFELFAQVKRPLSLREVVEQLGAPKSSCHELLYTLLELGYMYTLDGGRLFYPSRRLLEQATAIDTHHPVREQIVGFLKDLRDATGETAVVGKLDRTWVAYMEVFEGTHAIRYSAQGGDRKSVHATALGKALLGGLDKEQRQRVIPNLNLERFSSQTITSPRELLLDIKNGDRRGLYVTRGEGLPDVMAIAVPVNIVGHPLAVALAGPLDRMERNLERYSNALLQTQKNINEIPSPARR